MRASTCLVEVLTLWLRSVHCMDVGLLNYTKNCQCARVCACMRTFMRARVCVRVCLCAASVRARPRMWQIRRGNGNQSPGA